MNHESAAGPKPTLESPDPIGPGAGRDVPPLDERSPLERRYRRVLRVLPRPYREAREQEMVDTFLDSEFGADPDNADLTAKFGSVGWRETASVVALALRLRWADPVGPERYRIRLAALQTTLLAVLTMYGVQTVISLIDRLRLALWPIDPGDEPALGIVPPLLGWWTLATQWAFVLWIPALLLALRGGRRATGWAAAVALVPTVVTLVEAIGYPVVSARWWMSVLIDAGAVVGLVAVAVAGRGTAVRRRRGLLIGAGIAVVGWEAAFAAVLLVSPSLQQVPGWLATLLGVTLFDYLGLWTVALLAVGVTMLIRTARGNPAETAGLLALSWFAGAIGLLHAGWLVDWSPLLSSGWTVGPASLMVGMLVQFALTVAIAVTAGIAAGRRIRRMPTVCYAPAPPAGPPATA